ncbi:MAG: hypothetical protein J6L93_02450, partial [Butyrivibrio sp.]|nr:hypothetical protein [Butyrivibrio sp.]
IAPPRLPENYRYTVANKDCKDIPKDAKKADKTTAVSLSYKLDSNKSGFDGLIISLNEHGPSSISFKQGDTSHTVNFGIGFMCDGSFPIYNTPYTAGGMWSRGNVLYIKAHLIGECVGSLHFQLFFEPNEVTVFMRKIEETYYQEFEGHLQGHLL